MKAGTRTVILFLMAFLVVCSAGCKTEQNRQLAATPRSEDVATTPETPSTLHPPAATTTTAATATPAATATATAATATATAVPTPPSATPDRVPISPENAHAVVQLWQADMPDFLELHETCGVAFSPDGIYLAAACRSTTIPLWDVASGQLVRTFGGGGYVWANVAFSPDGETLASSGQEGAISLWDVCGKSAMRRGT